MITIEKNEDNVYLKTYNDFFRAIPVVINDKVPKDQILLVNLKTGDILGRIINLALPVNE